MWREGLRLHPAGSVVPIRFADREVVLRSGLRIPRGTFLWLSIVAVHLSPFNYIEPERFWPVGFRGSPRRRAEKGRPKGLA